MLEYREMAVLAFNILNGLMICVAIGIAGLGSYVWQTKAPAVSTYYEKRLASQGLLSGLLGAFVSVLAWLGAFGVNNEKPKFITSYLVIFSLLLIPTILMAIFTLVYLAKWMKAADDGLKNHMEKYYTDGHSANITDAIQLGYQCCGMKPMPHSYDNLAMLPASCCDPLLFRITEETMYCQPRHKFSRTCEGELTKYLVSTVMWLSSLLLLLATFFIALLVDLHFVRRPSKTTVQKHKDAAALVTVNKHPIAKEVKEKNTKPDKQKDSLQKSV